MSGKSDEELMYLYGIHADSSAFDELFMRYRRKVYSYIGSKIRDVGARDDVFQQVFLKLHQKKHTYRYPSRFAPWLFTICHNTFVDYIRKHRREIASDQMDRLSAPPNPETKVDLSELQEHLKNLPEGQRQVIELRYLSGETYAAIATFLGTTPQNVRQLVSRSLKKLKRLLTKAAPKEREVL
jgi:RNA polymerase sigma-70 factor (ECF subfamily)